MRREGPAVSPSGGAAPTAAGVLTAEAVVRHARKSDTMSRLAFPAPEAEAGEGAERWPAGARVLFLIGAAALCWAVVLLAGWWLIG